MRGLIFALLLAWPNAASAQPLSDLAWLKGCWRFERDGDVVTESWIAPEAPVMLGFATTRRAGELRFWEQTRIVSDADGIAFVAMPNGGSAVRFALADRSERRVAFANPTHDFPQRVEYARDGDALTAVASGAGGEPEVFPYRRIRCPSELRP